MRHKSRTIFAALVAVFAFAAVASASALAALPEFIPSEGAKWPITMEGSAATASGRFDTINGHNWECSGNRVKGEITAAKALSATLELTNCSNLNEGGFQTGEEVGTVVLSGKGTLVYLNKAEKKVGILDEIPATEIRSEGGQVNIHVRGKLLIPITPINTSTTKFTLPIHGEGGLQEHRTYENEKGEVIKGHLEYAFNGGAYKEADLNMEGENHVTASKALTVKG
jgi:hypothetical protein